jgi:hypothetical protein
MNFQEPQYLISLPTEAEWEFAARAGSATRFYFGDDERYESLPNYAWFKENASGRSQKVAQKIPNEWGIYDIVPPEYSSNQCLCGFSCVLVMQPANFWDGHNFSMFRCFDCSRFRTILIQ